MAQVLKGKAAKRARQGAAKAKATAAPVAEKTEEDHALQAAQDLAILHPDGQVQIRGRLLAVREYGYIEGLQLQPGIRLFLDALYAEFKKSDEAPPSAEQIREVIVSHAVTLQWLMAQAITPYPQHATELESFSETIRENSAWIGTLNDIEGDALQALWWGVNAGFFIRRFRERLLAERKAKAESPSDQPASTPT